MRKRHEVEHCSALVQKEKILELCLPARVEVREDVQEAGRRLWFVFSHNNSDSSPPPQLLLYLFNV